MDSTTVDTVFPVESNSSTNVEGAAASAWQQSFHIIVCLPPFWTEARRAPPRSRRIGAKRNGLAGRSRRRAHGIQRPVGDGWLATQLVGGERLFIALRGQARDAGQISGASRISHFFG